MHQQPAADLVGHFGSRLLIGHAMLAAGCCFDIPRQQPAAGLVPINYCPNRVQNWVFWWVGFFGFFVIKPVVKKLMGLGFWVFSFFKIVLAE